VITALGRGSSKRMLPRPVAPGAQARLSERKPGEPGWGGQPAFFDCARRLSAGRCSMSDRDLYSFSALWCYYRICRRNKRNTLNALAFEIDVEAKLLALQRELRDHTYTAGRSICFVTDGLKPREVFAADFLPRYALRATRDGRALSASPSSPQRTYRGAAGKARGRWRRAIG